MKLWSTLAADFPGESVVNLGFGGSTLAECVYYYDRLVAPCEPRALVVYAGDNDLAGGSAPEAVAEALRALLARVDARAGGIPLLFLSVKPSLARWHLIEEIRQANALARRELAGRAGSGYVDLHPAMLGSDGRPRPELFVEDGLHLSAAGYALWRQAILQYRDLLFP